MESVISSLPSAVYPLGHCSGTDPSLVIRAKAEYRILVSPSTSKPAGWNDACHGACHGCAAAGGRCDRPRTAPQRGRTGHTIFWVVAALG